MKLFLLPLLSRRRQNNVGNSPADPTPGRLRKKFANPVIATFLLLLPAGIAVTQANRFADWLYNPLSSFLGHRASHQSDQ